MEKIGTWAGFYRSGDVSLVVEAARTPRSPLRVDLDCTSLLDRSTGVGAFTRALAQGLAARDDIALTAFAVSLRGRGGLSGAVPASVTVRARPVPARVARVLWQRLDHPTARLLAGPADVVHGPNHVVPPGGSAAEVVTVHDLTALHFPEMCTADVLQWPGLLRRALRRGAWVHTVSRFVAEEVRVAFPEAGDRVVTVPNGFDPLDPPSATTDASAGHHLVHSTRYVLAVGTVEPRKDLPTLVAAFDAVADGDEDLRLVIAGSDGLAADDLTAAIDAARHRDRIVRLGRVSTEHRSALLRGATVVAYPSRYEGFGLVPLEAMAAGVPVVATAVGAIPEVVGQAALLVAPHDVAALAGALSTVLEDSALRESLIDEGTARIERYSWARTVTGMVELYQRAADAR